MSLSKSDFKIASTCIKKLKYKKLGYESSMEENDFMKMLAEGGYIIGKLATLIYPGTEITGNTGEALRLTGELLQNDEITLHEAAVESAGKIVRIDILQKKGNHFNLIEVKSKSFNGAEDEEQEKKNLEEYIEDVIYQTLVLQETFPDANINSFLLMPDKDQKTQIEGLGSWFKVVTSDKDVPPGVFRKIEVDFIYAGKPEYETKRQQLVADKLLTLLNLDNEVTEKRTDIESRTATFLEIIENNYQYRDGQYQISKSCKGCEFRAIKNLSKDGYRECWGDLADVKPHIFDMYYGGSIGHYKTGFYLNELIGQKKVSLFDIDRERLKNKNGQLSSRGQRQLIQLENTKTGKEWSSSNIGTLLSEWSYPLHFIDFETYTGAIPFHQGMRPYEVVAFQWSCHTINGPGQEPVHTEWINTEPGFPNFRFAEALMKQIGDDGTPLMWATHENTVLRKILKQMESRGFDHPRLNTWLTIITSDSDEKRVGRLVDMNRFTVENYFHPYMKGRSSIKKTLPAVWNYHPQLHEVPWFKKYFRKDSAGEIMDPYQTLKFLFAAKSAESELAERELAEVVAEGSAAMKAYFDMQYGDPDKRDEIKNQLLEYCKLDTMAMVIIWYYWSGI